MANLVQDTVTAFEDFLPTVFSPFAVCAHGQKFMAETLEAHRYPLCAGGKRIRPLMVSLLARAIAHEKASELSLRAGAALECVHTYSLVHDDLPCMDNDDFRRGNPTTHRVFGEAKALLVGDGLLTSAFEILAKTPSQLSFQAPQRLAEWACLSSLVLSEAAGYRGMIFGQWVDVSKFSYAERNSEDLWKTIAFNKTGCLLGCALELGVLSGLTAVSNSQETLYCKRVENVRSLAKQCGQLVGLVFQIVDDVLDVTASSEQMGKTTGKDLQQNKLTAVQLWGLSRAREVAAAETARAQNMLRELWNELENSTETEINSEAVLALESLLQSLLLRQK